MTDTCHTFRAQHIDALVAEIKTFYTGHGLTVDVRVADHSPNYLLTLSASGEQAVVRTNRPAAAPSEYIEAGYSPAEVRKVFDGLDNRLACTVHQSDWRPTV